MKFINLIKRNAYLFIAIALMCFFALTSLAVSTTELTIIDTNKTVDVGGTFTIDDMKISILKTERQSILSLKNATTVHPDAGNEFMIVTLEITNNNKEYNLPFNDSWIYIETEDGVGIYSAGYDIYENGGSGYLTPGSTIIKDVIFEVPMDTNCTINY